MKSEMSVPLSTLINLSFNTGIFPGSSKNWPGSCQYFRKVINRTVITIDQFLFYQILANLLRNFDKIAFKNF